MKKSRKEERKKRCHFLHSMRRIMFMVIG